MSIRERVLALLNGHTPDCVPWLADLSYWCEYARIDKVVADAYFAPDGVFQLHRDLRVGFYLQGFFPFETRLTRTRMVHSKTNGESVTTIDTPAGSIRQRERYLPASYCGAVTEHYVKSAVDLKAIRAWYEDMRFEPSYEPARQRYSLIGDNGIVLCYLPKSPFMDLVALHAGIEATTMAWLDDRQEFETTLQIMEEKNDQAAQVALESPAECLMIPENLSSEVVGKEFYLRYMRPYEEKWVRRIRDAGKYSFIHMDGTLKGLIREVSQTGFDVLESMTAKPVGDMSLDEMDGVTRPEAVLWGGIPGALFPDSISDSAFDGHVIEALESMKRHPRFVIASADLVPPFTRWNRIRRVGDLVERHGKLR